MTEAPLPYGYCRSQGANGERLIALLPAEPDPLGKFHQSPSKTSYLEVTEPSLKFPLAVGIGDTAFYPNWQRTQLKRMILLLGKTGSVDSDSELRFCESMSQGVPLGVWAIARD